jgi:hypothetical protein
MTAPITDAALAKAIRHRCGECGGSGTRTLYRVAEDGSSTALHPPCLSCGERANKVEQAIRARLTAAEAENTRLRAALAQSDRPCVYCTLPADEWSKCAQGFPGCGRADDAMGCPHLGASIERDRLRKALEEIAANPLPRSSIEWSREDIFQNAAWVRDRARAALSPEPRGGTA